MMESRREKTVPDQGARPGFGSDLQRVLASPKLRPSLTPIVKDAAEADEIQRPIRATNSDRDPLWRPAWVLHAEWYHRPLYQTRHQSKKINHNASRLRESKIAKLGREP